MSVDVNATRPLQWDPVRVPTRMTSVPTHDLSSSDEKVTENPPELTRNEKSELSPSANGPRLER